MCTRRCRTSSSSRPIESSAGYYKEEKKITSETAVIDIMIMKGIEEKRTTYGEAIESLEADRGDMGVAVLELVEQRSDRLDDTRRLEVDRVCTRITGTTNRFRNTVRHITLLLPTTASTEGNIEMESRRDKVDMVLDGIGNGVLCARDMWAR